MRASFDDQSSPNGLERLARGPVGLGRCPVFDASSSERWIAASSPGQDRWRHWRPQLDYWSLAALDAVRCDSKWIELVARMARSVLRPTTGMIALHVLLSRQPSLLVDRSPGREDPSRSTLDRAADSRTRSKVNLEATDDDDTGPWNPPPAGRNSGLSLTDPVRAYLRPVSPTIHIDHRASLGAGVASWRSCRIVPRGTAAGTPRHA